MVFSQLGANTFVQKVVIFRKAVEAGNATVKEQFKMNEKETENAIRRLKYSQITAGCGWKY